MPPPGAARQVRHAPGRPLHATSDILSGMIRATEPVPFILLILLVLFILLIRIIVRVAIQPESFQENDIHRAYPR